MARINWYYNFGNKLRRYGTMFLIWAVAKLKEQTAYALIRWLSLVVWHLYPKWRRYVFTNLRLFYGDELSLREQKKIARESAIHLGYHAVEFIRIGLLPMDEVAAMVVETEGNEHLEAALAKGRGVIALAMHYGNFELYGASVAISGYQIYAVGKEQSDPFITEVAFKRRERFGIKVVVHGHKLQSGLLKALKSNAILALLADVNGGTTGVFVPFAGVMASTSPGAAALALKTGAALIPVYGSRIAPGKHKISILPPLDLTDLPADKNEATIEILTRINDTYEELIRRDPSQWLWGHKRWWTRPPGEPPLY